jgi:hypothetical protein
VFPTLEEVHMWRFGYSGDLKGLERAFDEGRDILALEERTRDFEATALHFASEKGHVDMVRWILERCPRAASVRSLLDGRLPVHEAAMRGNVDVVSVLVHFRPFLLVVPNSVR